MREEKRVIIMGPNEHGRIVAIFSDFHNNMKKEECPTVDAANFLFFLWKTIYIRQEKTKLHIPNSKYRLIC